MPQWGQWESAGFKWSKCEVTYIFVHIIFQEIGAGITSVTIEYSKVAAFRPPPLEVRFCYVHDDGHSVLIVFFDHSMECVYWISFDDSIALLHKLGSRDPGHIDFFFTHAMGSMKNNDNKLALVAQII